MKVDITAYGVCKDTGIFRVEYSRFPKRDFITIEYDVYRGKNKITIKEVKSSMGLIAPCDCSLCEKNTYL